MRITSHAVGAVSVYLEPGGKVECLQIKYMTDRGWSWRHMMETGEGEETVIETLRNGLLDEIADDSEDPNFEYRLLRSDPIVYEFCRDERNPGGTHMKVFFLAEITRGKLRDWEKQDGKETLGPVTRAELGGVILLTEGKTVPIHVRASKAALVSLATDKQIFYRYQEFIESNPAQKLTAEEKVAIAAYPGKW